MNSITTTTRIVGVDGVPVNITKKVILRIRPWFESAPHEFLDASFWVLPKGNCWDQIMPSYPLEPCKELDRGGVPYADPKYWTPQETHLLFGVGFFCRHRYFSCSERYKWSCFDGNIIRNHCFRNRRYFG